MGDKYHLEWKLFHETLSESLRELRDDKDFSNVTLAFDDDNFIEVNSLILSACSKVLKGVIKKSKHPHIFIYLSGLSSATVTFLLDFMYNGEVSVPHDEVDRFLAAAHRLKVKGLIQLNKEEIEETNEFDSMKPGLDKSPFIEVESKEDQQSAILSQKLHEDVEDVKSVIVVGSHHNADEVSGFFFNKTTSEDEVVGPDEKFDCKICGKFLSTNKRLGKHMDKWHVQEGVFHPCSFCSKSFGTKNARNVHHFRNHKN